MPGVVRGKRHRTIIQGGKNSTRDPDLLDRDFTSEAPNRKWVTDFTYTRTWAGLVHTVVQHSPVRPIDDRIASELIRAR